MKTEYTLEPWKSIEDQFHGEVLNFIGDKDGRTIGEIYTKDDTRRIVACVNACAGLPTEVLERYKLGVIGVDYKSTKQQRDELEAALRECREVLMHYQYGGSSYKEPADKAIAKIDAMLK